jgi:hypothetical protein
MDEDALVFARALQEEPELERRLFGFLVSILLIPTIHTSVIPCSTSAYLYHFKQAKLAVKGAVKAGKAAAHHHHNKHHKRDIESVEELFERDLEFDDELFERSLEGEEELELFERDYENLEELD